MLKRSQLRSLRFATLLFLLPGLAGLLVAASMSTNYLDRMPRMPIPVEMRYTQRNIHGIVVYQTVEEDRKLSVIEYTSMGVFLLGLGLGLVYLHRWGIAAAIRGEEDDHVPGIL